jgi:hypothetical protein
VQNRQILDRGLISQKSRDLFARFPNNTNNELFSNGGADRGHGGAPTGAWPSAAPVRQSSPAGTKMERHARGAQLGSHRSSGALWRLGDSGAERGGGGARCGVAVDSEASD